MVITNNKKLTIDSLIHFNDGFAVVLNTPIVYTYKRISRNTIIGQFGPIIVGYFFEELKSCKAFGGRKFDLVMDDGEVVHCYGQWWSGFTEEAYKYIGTSNLTHITYSDMESLMWSYVFNSAIIIEEEYFNILSQYDGKVYDYFQYQTEVIKPKLLEIDNNFKNNLYENIISKGFRSLGNWTFDNSKYRIKLLNGLQASGHHKEIDEFKSSIHYENIKHILGNNEIRGVYYYKGFITIHIHTHHNDKLCFKITIK